jgi:hypothetical protein
MARKHRQLVARILLAAFVFAQAAVSAYACPEPTPAPAAAATAHDCGDMAGIDASAPNLCLAHCQIGQQTFDHSAHPGAAPAVLPPLIVAVPDLEASATPGRASNTLGFTGGAPPPHSILHCCLRI